MKSKFILAILVLTAVMLLAVSAPFGPTVVAKYSATGQTNSIGTTTLYTPSEDGDYDAEVYISADSSNNGSASFYIAWNDAYRSHSFNSASASGSGGNETTEHSL